MWRFLLPGFVALMVIGNAANCHASPPPSATPDPAPSPRDVGAQGEQDAHYAAYLQRQVNDLQDLVAQVKQQLAQRKALSPAAGAGGQQGAPHASQTGDLQRQDSELHNELQGLITRLEQELQLEERSPPVADVTEQQERQAARDALKHEIADLQREDNELQDLMAEHVADVAQREAPRPPAPDASSEKQTPSDDALHQAPDLRSQIADLQRQDDALQRQLAARKQELAQSAQELDAARAEANILRQSIDTLRRQRLAEEALLALDNMRHTVDALRQAGHPLPKAQGQ
jgi:chromosome segregation ATPase